MDAAIAQMVAFTDTTPERAQQYLQVTDGDLDQAVSLFFENGGADLGGSTTIAAPAAATERLVGAGAGAGAGVGNSQDPIHIDDDDHVSDDNDPTVTGYRRPTVQPSAADDEAMARRLQEEMYGGAGEEGVSVRAPIARQAETLIGPGASDYYGGGTLDQAIEERMMQMQNRRGRRAPGIFNQQPTSRIWQEGGANREALAESTGGASETNSRANHLARLYAPNWELMFNGSWEEARDMGKDEKKWLLVNIQNEQIFDCQVLNRDIWKNEGVIETVREKFVFLQYSKNDPRAEQYIQYYFQNSDVDDEYPHVAVVDPRTGEQVKLWSRKMPGPADFLMQLYEFLDRYSLESFAKNPVAKRKSEAKKEKPVELLTEEEQLERALQASMATGEADTQLRAPTYEDPDDLTRSIGDIKGKSNASIPNPKQDQNQSQGTDEPDVDTDMMEDAGPTAQNGAAPSPFSLIPSDKPHQEPPTGPNVTRIQLRHPGGRIVRRFNVDDPVQRIYEYLKAEPIDDRQGVEFELVAMGKNLMDSRELSIQEAGLKMGTVMVEFLD